MSPTYLGIAPWKDMSGYASLAKNYMRALLLVDSKDKWVLASTKYDSGSRSRLPDILRELHAKQISSDIQTVVQILTPNEMVPVQGKRNIAICCWETDRIPPHWAMQLNACDIIIVPCQANKEAFERSGVTKPIVVIGMPAFSEDYNLDKVEPYQIPGISSDTTIYYNIAQWSHKKGIDAVIRSYLLAFQQDENVLLVLKGYIGMLKQHGDASKVVGAINEIKAAMRLQKYPRIYVSDTVMSESELKKIHKLGDCYVNMARGEGWCCPAFDALCYGKELISVTHTGMAEWALQDKVWPVESYRDAVHNMPHNDNMLYTSREVWYEPSVLSGAEALQSHFKGMKKNDEAKKQSLLQQFNPLEIGTKLKEIIDGQK